MADALIGVTEAQRRALILGLVQKQLIASAKLAPTVMNVSEFSVPGAKSIAFPYAGNFSVGDKAENAEVEAQILTYSADTLELSKHKVVQWIIEKIASLQSAVAIEVDAISRAVKGLAKQLDSDIYAAIKGASAADPDHKVAYAGDTIAIADILTGIKLLDIQDVPEEDRFLAINPTEKAEILAIEKFIDASKLGSGAPLYTGQIGQIYGIPVIVSTVVATDNSVLYHRESTAWGLQAGPDYDTQKDLANLGMRHSIDQLYGVKTLDGGKRQVLLGTAG